MEVLVCFGDNLSVGSLLVPFFLPPPPLILINDCIITS